jgi:hypothetical protein
MPSIKLNYVGKLNLLIQSRVTHPSTSIYSAKERNVINIRKALDLSVGITLTCMPYRAPFRGLIETSHLHQTPVIKAASLNSTTLRVLQLSVIYSIVLEFRPGSYIPLTRGVSCLAFILVYLLTSCTISNAQASFRVNITARLLYMYCGRLCSDELKTFATLLLSRMINIINTLRISTHPV